MLGRVQVPTKVKAGEPFEVRVLVQHPMENGFRRDMHGAVIPVHILDRVVCRIDGIEVFRARLGTGIAANPYLAFHAVARTSGTVEVEWSDDRGAQGHATAAFTVES